MVENGQLVVDRPFKFDGNFRRFYFSLILFGAFSLLLMGCSGDEKSSVIKGRGSSSAELLQKGQQHFSSGRYRASIIEARNAVQQNPDDIAGYVLIAQVFNHLGQGKLATRELEKYQGEKNRQYRVQYAKALLNQKKFHSARNALNELGEANLPTEQAENAILKAQSSYGLRNLDEAENHFNEAFEKSSDNTDLKATALVGLAKVSLAEGDEAKSLQYLEQSITVKENSEALMLKGILAFKKRQIDDAEDLLSQALVVLPKGDVMTPLRTRVLEGLTKILIQQGRSAEALVYSKILADANPAAQEMKTKFANAMEVYQSGDMKKAEQMLNELYLQSGKSDVGGKMLGIVNYEQGNFAEANTFFNEHLDAETVSPQLLKFWAGTELQLNRPEKAAQILQQRLELTPNDADLLTLYSLVQLTGGDYDAALETLNKAIAIEPTKEKVRLSFSQYLNSKGRPEEALLQLEMVFKRFNEDPEIQARYLRQLLALRKTDNAWAEAQALIKYYPNNAETHALGGTIALKLKQYKESRQYFNRALELQADLASAKLGLAQWHIANKNYADAFAAFEAIIESSPEQLYGYNGLLTAALLDGNADQALELLKAKSNEDKSNAAPVAILASYALKNAELSKAISLAEQALERNEALPYARKVLVTAYYKQGLSEVASKRYDDARKSILEAIRVDPNNMRLLGALAEIEITAGQHREAAKVISQIETLFPGATATTILKGDLGLAKQMLDDAEAAYLDVWKKQPSDLAGRKLYELYIGKKDLSKAIQLLEEWRTNLPKSGAPLLLMALQKQKGEDFPAAITLYEELLVIAPKSALGYNNLAWLYSEVGDHRALETAEKAYLLAPGNGAVADTYGWLLVGEGNLTKGVDILTKAVEDAPGNAEIRAHLEMARAKL